MADVKPIGIDQTTGQQRPVAADDTVNLGNEIEIVVSPGFDYSNVPPRVFAQFPFDTPTLLLGTPASAPDGASVGLAWSPNGEFLAATDTSGSQRFHLYQRIGNTLYRLADPASLPTSAGDVSWSPNGELVTVAGFTGTSSFRTFQRNGATLTPLADPASVAGGTSGVGVSYSPNGQYMTVGTSGAQFLYTYEVDGTTFTLLPSPASLPVSSVNDVAWSPDGRFLAVVESNAPYLNIYEHDGAGTLTRLPDPSTVSPGFSLGVAWSNSGEFLAVGSTGNAPDLLVYQRSGSNFTGVFALDFGSGYINDIRWSPNDRYMATAGLGSGLFRIYEQDGTTFTTLTNPASLPGSQYYTPVWSPDGQFIAVGGAGGGNGRFGLYQIQTTMPESGVAKTVGRPLAGS